MAKKCFHYLIVNRDEIHQGDFLGHEKKWKISGEETITDITSILFTDYLPWNPPKRTETWVLLCGERELALLQHSWEKPIFFVDVDEKVSKYFNDKGDFAIYLQCLWGTYKEKYFHEHGLQDNLAK